MPHYLPPDAVARAEFLAEMSRARGSESQSKEQLHAASGSNVRPEPRTADGDSSDGASFSDTGE